MGLGRPMVIAMLIACACASPRPRRERTETVATLPVEGTVYDARMRITGSFAGVELATTRAHVRLWVIAASATEAVLRARVSAMRSDGSESGADDVEVILDAHGRVTGAPRSFCPSIDELVATRVLFSLLGTAPAREGGHIGDEGPIRSELDEAVGTATFRHRVREGRIEVLGDGALELSSARLGDTVYRGPVHVRLRERLDARDLLLRRVTLELRGDVEAATLGQPPRTGALVLVSDWEITPAAADAPAAPTCSEAATASGAVTAGAACAPADGFDMNAVVAAIDAQRAAITRCYEAALREDRTLAGRVRISMTIEPSGEVDRVRVIEDSLGRGVATCIVPIIETFSFETPPRCGAVTYAFPFVFEPAS